MSETFPPTRAMKYVQKEMNPAAFALGGLVFFALYFVQSSLFDNLIGFAILPALIIAHSGPETRRDWLLALLAAGLVAVMMWVGAAVGGWLFGYRPATDITGPHDRLLVASPGLLPAIFVSYLTVYSLGRRAITPSPGDKKTSFDIGLWQGTALLVAGLGTFASLLVLERAYLAGDCGIWFSMPVQGLFVVLLCGGTVMLAWPTAGKRRAALLGHVMLAVAIVGASHPLGQMVYCLNNDWSSFAGFMGGMSVLAIYFAAVVLAWWQLRHFAHRHGMLDFPNAN